MAAFLTGWTSFVAGFSGAIAVTSMSFAGYLGRFLPFASDTTPFFSIPLGVMTLSLTSQSLIALLLIVALSGIHILGWARARRAERAGGDQVVGADRVRRRRADVGNGSWEHFQGGSSVAPSGWLLALIPVMFSYSGWNAAAYIAEEIADPDRNVPLALALGTIAVVIALRADERRLHLRAARRRRCRRCRCVWSTRRPIGCSGSTAGEPAGAVSLMIFAGSISAMVFAGPRVYLAMARDGLFLPQAARIHPAIAHRRSRSSRRPSGAACW